MPIQLNFSLVGLDRKGGILRKREALPFNIGKATRTFFSYTYVISLRKNAENRPKRTSIDRGRSIEPFLRWKNGDSSQRRDEYSKINFFLFVFLAFQKVCVKESFPNVVKGLCPSSSGMTFPAKQILAYFPLLFSPLSVRPTSALASLILIC